MYRSSTTDKEKKRTVEISASGIAMVSMVTWPWLFQTRHFRWSVLHTAIKLHRTYVARLAFLNDSYASSTNFHPCVVQHKVFLVNANEWLHFRNTLWHCCNSNTSDQGKFYLANTQKIDYTTIIASSDFTKAQIRGVFVFFFCGHREGDNVCRYRCADMININSSVVVLLCQDQRI